MKRVAFLSVAALLSTLALLPALRSQERWTLSDEHRALAPGKFLKLPQGIVHYDVAGPETGQVVVLVHGFSVPFYVWDPTFRALADAGFRVIRYDLFGRGYSDRPEARYDRAFFEQQLLDLLTGLALEMPVDLIGLSMGGPIVAGFVANHPNWVRRWALVDPLFTAPPIVPLNIPLLGEYLTHAFYLPMLPDQQQDNFHRAEAFPGWSERYCEQMRYKGFGRALLASLRHFVSQDHGPAYREAGRQGRPALLIWGSEDRVTPIADHVTVQSLLDAEFLRVEGAGHLAHYEQPETVNPALVDFLS
ncbi:MAG: alpha/beta hydrolase [Ardenticatenales bacterium]|nr:alpha/beta hydrolase [Ardenticatenales bacterium]